MAGEDLGRNQRKCNAPHTLDQLNIAAATLHEMQLYTIFAVNGSCVRRTHAFVCLTPFTEVDPTRGHFGGSPREIHTSRGYLRGSGVCQQKDIPRRPLRHTFRVTVYNSTSTAPRRNVPATMPINKLDWGGVLAKGTRTPREPRIVEREVGSSVLPSEPWELQRGREPRASRVAISANRGRTCGVDSQMGLCCGGVSTWPKFCGSAVI